MDIKCNANALCKELNLLLAADSLGDPQGLVELVSSLLVHPPPFKGYPIPRTTFDQLQPSVHFAARSYEILISFVTLKEISSSR